ncbi:hypothetical protein ASD62_09765 [Phycicoccus sp. Root563]|uniref:hypothetical protein n=1 Tax=unclassified Phycicoccus TaxID=2637926 RepID=UPI00070304E6|nr:MULTISPECIES: hypothetical protein [unclassified Phycicoccus]KQU65328.1 hypothetical protein ASC58_17710 [Phycicoccus sp. Root101]KQZ89547.1 hypothetical protein ASD62_09765 [Phycicoccus sp. Root563]
MADYTIDTTVFGGNTFTSDVTADVNSTLAGLDDMKLTLAGGTTNTNNGENTVHTDSAITLAPVTTTSTVNTTSRLDSASSVDTTASVDLKPVAVDTCVRLELGPPPATEVCVPYDQQWSWSVLGLELFAITVRGSTTAHIRPEHRGPVVIDL